MMQFLRSGVRYVLSDHKTNAEITKYYVYNLHEIIVDCTCKWAEHLLRMNDTYIPW